ncbi:nucleoside triphosphate pyrophosphatase [Cognatiyoonia sp. IB215446]|uniref:Maf family protein n=1 Tax=Cognatiyoonia sp. IB215446 TaxID=3097355 RepID=UPI002A168DEA|nr:nucleoside triphosphate pyrophosphatase [Cognatiyoonia sp. IB215446]MDX8347363.1 nucleoside triphosphate pyrophosphatase [Cognatiyoonia sp. IB215446]
MTTLRPDHTLRLILGSSSPRRRELLAQLGITPAEIRPPDIDEDVRKGELPRDYVNRIAAEKAAAVPISVGEVALCADTTVALGRRIVGKPADTDEARAFLHALSGRRHKVITAVAVKRDGQIWQKDVQSTVALKRLSKEEINAYLASGDWQGKAGGYAIQGPAGAFVPWINGSYTGIVGLPLTETAGLLTAAGYPAYGRER